MIIPLALAVQDPSDSMPFVLIGLWILLLAVFVGFESARTLLPPGTETVCVGVPLRRALYRAFETRAERRVPTAPLRVFVFGGSQGVLCVGAPIIRFSGDVLNSGASGEMVFSPDLQNLPGGATFTHGSVWNFQLWYRDVNPNQTSNTSNGIEIIWD